jgi:hypothetical protein
MRPLLLVFISAIYMLVSCSESAESSDSEKLGAVNHVDKTPTQPEPTSAPDFAELTSSKDILTTHVVNVECGGEYVPLRNRALPESELHLSKEETEKSKAMKNHVIIRRLRHEWVRMLVEDSMGYHYVQLIDIINSSESNEQRNVRGFLEKEYCGKPTLSKFLFNDFRDIDDQGIPEFWGKRLPHGLLDYAYGYVTSEGDELQILTFETRGLNTIWFEIFYSIQAAKSNWFNGEAYLVERYKNEDGKIFSKYVSGYSLNDVEIHICDDEDYAVLSNQETSGFRILSSEVKMLRLK